MGDILVSPSTWARVKELDYIQSADTALLFHSAITPQILARKTDTAWTIGAVTLLNIPQFDFNDASSPTPTSEVQRLIFTNQFEGESAHVDEIALIPVLVHLLNVMPVFHLHRFHEV